MTRFIRPWPALLAIALLTVPQAVSQRDRIPRLPDGRSQHEAILKVNYQKALEQAAELVELSESLKDELEKNERHVLSLSSLKKTEQIEKLAKQIRSRLRRF
jgi:hypothetical protein